MLNFLNNIQAFIGRHPLLSYLMIAIPADFLILTGTQSIAEDMKKKEETK